MQGNTARQWVLRDQPYRGMPKRRRAYESGFVQRVFDVREGTTMPVPSYKYADDDAAWAMGYDDAKRQEGRSNGKG